MNHTEHEEIPCQLVAEVKLSGVFWLRKKAKNKYRTSIPLKQCKLMWISHHVPVEGPQAKRFSVLTSAFDRCHGSAAPRLPTPPTLRRDRQKVARRKNVRRLGAPRRPVALRVPSHFPAAPDLQGYGIMTFWPLSLSGHAFIVGVIWRLGVGSGITLWWNGSQPQLSGHEKRLYSLGGGDRSLHFTSHTFQNVLPTLHIWMAATELRWGPLCSHTAADFLLQLASLADGELCGEKNPRPSMFSFKLCTLQLKSVSWMLLWIH